MRTLIICVTVSLLGLAALSAGAEEKKEDKKEDKTPATPVPAPTQGKAPASPKGAAPDPSGTWTWTVTRPGGESFSPKLTIACRGDAVSGSSTGPRGEEMPIQDGRYKDGALTFRLSRDGDEGKFQARFSGKVSKEAITGTIVVAFGGEERTMPWEAHRAK